MTQTAVFPGLVDLLSADLGGLALGASDDFFAEVTRINLPEPAVFIPDRYTDRGKWMDGWESRRKRQPGHDFCVLRLGAQGVVRGFDIDTSHFRGNQPAFASIDAVVASPDATFEQLLTAEWSEILQQTRLQPDAHNLCVATVELAATHLRLNVFPDGGVARFRAYGRITGAAAEAEYDAVQILHLPPGLVDLAALKNGASVLACSDAHFGAEHQLILPGRARNMGSGWETRRRRAPGHDWLVLQLAAPGCVHIVEVDTQHFKGNYPDSCSLEAIHAPGASPTELIASERWIPLLEPKKLEADHRHFLPVPEEAPSATHLRLNIYPDGGISRLRAWGERDG